MFRSTTLLLVAASLFAIFVAADISAQETGVDAFTGLIIADDWELVRNNCIACHSSKLVTQQRGSASQWLSVIRWMQDKQNLWQFDPDTESRIINYLATNYPPREDQRRLAIAPQLMPPNPFAAKAE